MTTLSKEAVALVHLTNVVEAAIASGDWKVDGACDPHMALSRAHQVLADGLGLARDESWCWVIARG
jgi:hypothetical protein